MPQLSNVHISAPLTNLAIKYKNLAFVAEKVFPIVKVIKESDRYYKFKKEELMDVQSLRAAGAEANEISWDVDNETYSAEEYALRHLVPDRIVNNADVAIKPKMTTTQKLLKWLLLGYEKRVQAIVQSTANITNFATPAPRWNQASPTIEANVDTAKASVRNNCGVEPNSLLMSSAVADVVKRDTTVRDLIRYTVPNKELLINGSLPPVLWNLAVIIGGSIENSAKEGQTEALASVWGDGVLVFYKEIAAALDALTLGYTLRVANTIVSTWREDKRKGEMVEASIIQAEELVSQEAGYLITDVLA